MMNATRTPRPCAARLVLMVAAVAAACSDPVVPADTEGGSTTAGPVGSSDDGVGSSDGGTSTGSSPDPDSTSGTTDDSDSASTSSSTSEGEVCGNGMIDRDEQCDADDLSDEDCISQGFDLGRLTCAEDCTFDTSMCAMAVCGNGVAEGEEPCDGEDLGVRSCEAMGFDGGALECTPRCTVDDSHCTTKTSYCSMAGFTLIEPGTLVIPVTVPPVEGTVVGVDITLEAVHSAVGFLEVTVEHTASAVSVILAQNICGSADGINAIFDQAAAAPPDCVEPDAIEGNVLPLEDLDQYLGVADLSGMWTLTIVDSGPGDMDPGALISWCVQVETEIGMP